MTTAADSATSKVANASCPAGKVVTGAGASINGGTGQVVLTGYYPVHGSTDYAQAAAHEDADGYAGDWSLTVYATCVTAVPGTVEVSASSLVNSFADKGVTVACPAGSRVIGMGGVIVGGAGQVDLTDVYVTADLSAAGAFGVEHAGGYEASWSVGVFAICLPGATAAVEVEARDPSGGDDTTAPKSVTANCPAGTYAHGTGARLDGTLLHEGITGVVPGTLLTGEVARADVDEFGQPGPWALIAILICDP